MARNGFSGKRLCKHQTEATNTAHDAHALWMCKVPFWYGNIEEDIYIEDMWKKEGHVRKLIKAMYETRYAPSLWQNVLREKMKALRFNVCVRGSGLVPSS